GATTALAGRSCSGDHFDGTSAAEAARIGRLFVVAEATTHNAYSDVLWLKAATYKDSPDCVEKSAGRMPALQRHGKAGRGRGNRARPCLKSAGKMPALQRHGKAGRGRGNRARPCLKSAGKMPALLRHEKAGREREFVRGRV